MRRRVLKDTPKVRDKIKNLPKVYLVGRWARYGVMAFPFGGKFVEKYGAYIPLVWNYNDHNGTDSLWYLRPIYDTTTGQCLTYSFDENTANKIADAFNQIG